MRGPGRPRHPVGLLQTFRYDFVTLGQSLRDNKIRPDLLTEFDVFLLDLLVRGDRERKRTLLVPLDRRLGNHERGFRVRRFQQDGDIGSRKQANILVLELPRKEIVPVVASISLSI